MKTPCISVRWLSRILGFSLLVMLMACSRGAPELGLWVSDEDKSTMEFKPNNEVTVVDNMEYRVSGTYELADDGTVLFQLMGPPVFGGDSSETTTINMRGKMEIKKDELRLTLEGDRDPIIYERR